MPPRRVARAVESIRSALRKVSLKMVPPPVAIFDLATGFVTSQAIFAAASLGIADALADGPLSPNEIAEAIGAEPAATQRLLRALSAQSIFSERADGRYEMTALAQPLRSSGPMSVRPALLMLGYPFYWEHYGHLTDCVRSGKTSVQEQYGLNLFECFDQDPVSAQVFHDAMTCLTAMSAPAILAAYDFSRAHTIVDIGGGNGQLLAAILRVTPTTRGVLFEQAAIESMARKVFEQAGVGQRAEVQVGSFFETVPTGGDIYVLKHIVHDWDDAKALDILKRVRRAMQPGGSLLLIECVIPTGDKPHFGKYLDLDMLIFSGGKERTVDQFSDLLGSAGFRLRRVIPTVTFLSLIEAAVA